VTSPFQSYSRNAEDVVLWRALRGAGPGRYVEVRSNPGRAESVSTAFYARGWSGVIVEPNPEVAGLHRERRPDDVVVGTGEPGASSQELDSILQRAGWAQRDIHFMWLEAPGSGPGMAAGIDLEKWRPWVLVIENLSPETPAARGGWADLVAEARYRFCLFDGVSCFYVSEERNEQLAPSLSYPACVRDDYVSPGVRECQAAAAEAVTLAQERAAEITALREEVIRWRTQAIARWAASVVQPGLAQDWQAHNKELQALQLERSQLVAEAHALRQRVVDLQQSTSWRVTQPLRAASGLVGRVRSHP
jgi:hypothetical protein